MSTRKNDEWGKVIKKQLELDKVRNDLEKYQARVMKQTYKNQLDEIFKIKQQKKEHENIEKEVERERISEQAKLEFEKNQAEKRKKIEESKRVTEDNLKLKMIIQERKKSEKNSLKDERLAINTKENQKIIENVTNQLQLKKKINEQLTNDFENAKEKKKLKKQKEKLEKINDLLLINQEQDRLKKQDLEFKNYFSTINEEQNKKIEIFEKSITPKLLEKEKKFSKWLQNSEEASRKLDLIQNYEKEKKKELDKKNIREVLRKQTEENRIKKNISKEKLRILDEELQKRVEYSFHIDEEISLKKKMDNINYRNELLAQAAQDKERKKTEFKLSEKERMLNKSVLDQDKNSLVRGANEILKSSKWIKEPGSPCISPSLKYTTLQIDYTSTPNTFKYSRLQNNRNSLF